MRMNMFAASEKAKLDTEYMGLKLGGSQTYDSSSQKAAVVV
jgi:hypothetical protein